MNKLILCEGATDAILLSYYLGRTAGWKFCRKPPKNLTIKEDRIEESINWYEKGDDRETASIEHHASVILQPVITKAESNKWITNTYRNSFDQEKQIDMLLVVIPVEQQGALETVLLDAISEDPYDAHIVDLVTQFVKTMRVEAGKYIKSRKYLKSVSRS
jgi:hypothetical protein